MSALPKLNLPYFSFRLRTQSGVKQLWDPLRKQWLQLTPEEWVRQNIIRHLIENRGVVAHYIIQEYPIPLGGMSQRADIVVMDPNKRPCLLIECKAPEIGLTESVWAQAIRYNSLIQAPYVLITNGMQHLCCEWNGKEKQYSPMREWPELAVFFRI